MKKLLLTLILIITSTILCYADNFNAQEQFMTEEQKKMVNNLYEKYKSCNKQKFIFFETLGMENGNCKFKSVKPALSESGPKYIVQYCDMPKNIYKSFIDDIRILDENTFSKKWESSVNTYCQTKIEN